jgi:membrane protease YdiL (CAAX protease family)
VSQGGQGREIWTKPLLGVLIAIAITATMDATGYSAASALPLFPLLLLYWRAERLSLRSMGFTWGRIPHYGLAVLIPVLVMGGLAASALMAKALDTSRTDWRKACLNLALVAASTILVALITEEGFFRGWLWASLKRGGRRDLAIVLVSSVAFTSWHISAVVLKTGFEPPPQQIPIFLANAAALGVIWGFLRAISGSVVVTSVSHGVWNGAAYIFFGYGKKIGALGIQQTWLFGPEVGVLGLLINVLIAVALWALWRRRHGSLATDEPPGPPTNAQVERSTAT